MRGHKRFRSRLRPFSATGLLSYNINLPSSLTSTDVHSLTELVEPRLSHLALGDPDKCKITSSALKAFGNTATAATTSHLLPSSGTISPQAATYLDTDALCYLRARQPS
jgi:hypothetical protein